MNIRVLILTRFPSFSVGQNVDCLPLDLQTQWMRQRLVGCRLLAGQCRTGFRAECRAENQAKGDTEAGTQGEPHGAKIV